jgi:hypothetical protein
MKLKQSMVIETLAIYYLIKTSKGARGKGSHLFRLIWSVNLNDVI